jgi:hypothetical protein
VDGGWKRARGTEEGKEEGKGGKEGGSRWSMEMRVMGKVWRNEETRRDGGEDWVESRKGKGEGKEASKRNQVGRMSYNWTNI